MPALSDKPPIFFVFIIESPSAADFYNGLSEGNVIKQALLLSGIQCSVVTAINRKMFAESFRVSLIEAIQASGGLIPIIHISAHGSMDSIQLSSGETVEWKELRKLLAPLNTALKNGLLVCMSTCEGFAGSRMAMHPEDKDYPFFALVGNASKPLWSETAVAYLTLYHLIARGKPVAEAVKAMRAAAGNDGFFVQTAAAARQSYIDHVNRQDLKESLQLLEQNTDYLDDKPAIQIRPWPRKGGHEKEDTNKPIIT